MASEKQKRKHSKRQSKLRRPPPPGPYRHKDGDRRHRGHMTADEASAAKEILRRTGEFAEPKPGAAGESDDGGESPRDDDAGETPALGK